MKNLKNSQFRECMIKASAMLLNEERYYKKPFDEMEIHQQVKVKTDADRCIKMLRIALIEFKKLKK